ncbi:hypothetical protein [Streptomyces sp. NPDC001389]|uniref:hypothetical protein n=1 Tax=unclassified Streptomyces TaxID=2593676 RepID=UPI00368EE17D
MFRERYRRVMVEETLTVTTSNGVTTAGAAFSPFDLALAVVASHSPAGPAYLVRRYLVVDDRASQAAYTIPSATARHEPLVAAFEEWVRARIAEPLSIADAARPPLRARPATAAPRPSGPAPRPYCAARAG